MLFKRLVSIKNKQIGGWNKDVKTDRSSKSKSKVKKKLKKKVGVVKKITDG